jgi:histidyl-tRNA synthetase
VSARAVVIIGADELARGEVTLRLMQSSEQRAVGRAEVVSAVKAALGQS